MKLPEFDKCQILKVLAGIAWKWGSPDRAREVEASLRAVQDPQGYLCQVAALGPEAAEALVHAAVLGLTISLSLVELAQDAPPG